VEQKIFITVQGGVAEVCEDTVPSGIVVEVLDFDNLDVDPVEEKSCWSPELRQYWEMNHTGRCEPTVPVSGSSKPVHNSCQAS